MNTKAGYVYALANPAMPGLIKVGRTQRHPQERAQELSNATGVAMPFVLLYYVFLEDCVRGEQIAHEQLSRVGTRFREGREFFRADSKTVVDVLIHLPKIKEPPQTSQQSCDIECETDSHNPFAGHISQLRQEAQCYRYGINGFPYEPELAIKKYNEIVSLGENFSLTDIAECHLQIAYDRAAKLSLRSDRSHLFKEAKKAGLIAAESDERAYQTLAEVAYEERNAKSFQVYMNRYFLSIIEGFESFSAYLSENGEYYEVLKGCKEVHALNIYSLALREYLLTSKVEPNEIYFIFKDEILECLSSAGNSALDQKIMSEIICFLSTQ
ncbi:GIY-YIG nuclease family protein [Roseovarius aquimarinus]|uniref:GIY-YIG nuclease family protein n=2 Tax=Roseovarius aquimarinus TaxID=1229156 RepID=A0ABW7I884_9RHOB